MWSHIVSARWARSRSGASSAAAAETRSSCSGLEPAGPCLTRIGTCGCQPQQERPRPRPILVLLPGWKRARSTSEAPGYTTAASPRLRRSRSPWPPGPGARCPTRNSPPMQGRVRTGEQPVSIGLSWRPVKGRNNTGSSRIPSGLAHRARPIRQYRAYSTWSRLLPPSPTTPGSGCLQLHRTAPTTTPSPSMPGRCRMRHVVIDPRTVLGEAGRVIVPHFTG